MSEEFKERHEVFILSLTLMVLSVFLPFVVIYYGLQMVAIGVKDLIKGKE